MHPAKTIDSVSRILAVVAAAALSGWVSTSFAAEAGQPASGNETTEAATIDWNAIDWDSAISNVPKPKPLSASGINSGPSTSWDRKDNPDGTTAVTVKHALPTEWDTKVGADLGLAPPPAISLRPMSPDSIVSGAAPERSTGAAWANMSVPGVSLNARLDSQQDQSQLGTTLSKSLPVGDTLSLTLQNSYALTNTLSNPANSATPGLIYLPPTAPGAPVPSRFYSTDRTARVSILPTGTTISAAEKMSTIDDKWLRSIAAEQKLFGGVSISGALSETTTGIPDRSITAGFKKNW